tara:strand:- start:870 stop:1250 length:381 start_codon:yes stop_codon:yes gene_type:complete
MGLNSTEVSYGFGQMGSAYLKDTSAFVPPTGSVIISIQVLDTCDFDLLTPDTSGYLGASAGASGIAGVGAAAYIGTSTPVGANGTNADVIATDGTETFTKGTTLFGRWTAVTLASGRIIMYFGPAV